MVSSKPMEAPSFYAYVGRWNPSFCSIESFILHPLWITPVHFSERGIKFPILLHDPGFVPGSILLGRLRAPWKLQLAQFDERIEGIFSNL